MSGPKVTVAAAFGDSPPRFLVMSKPEAWQISKGLTSEELVELIRELARAYADIHGCLPPPVRWMDLGLGRRRAAHVERSGQKAKAIAGSKRWQVLKGGKTK